MGVTGFAELTLEARDPEGLARFYARAFGMTGISRERTASGWPPGGVLAWDCGRPGPRSSTTRAGRTCTSPSPSSLARCPLSPSAFGPAGVGVDGPLEHEGGDRSLYARDPEGNVVEAWDLFERAGGSVDALR